MTLFDFAVADIRTGEAFIVIQPELALEPGERD